jgi:hypothetical protein
MSKITSFFSSLALILAITGTALAQEPFYPDDSDPVWKASYWNNKNLSGTPDLQRDESDLNHDWGSGSPAPGVIDADNFSARWTRYLYLTENTYKFTATSDDGIRVYVDDSLIIDQWNDHPSSTFSAEKSLSTGHHWVVVEFYEDDGAAVAKLSWEPTVASVQDWKGEYFNNVSLSGDPALVRDDAQIDFDWGGDSPASGAIDTDDFSVRWTRVVHLPAGLYRFEMTVDDGGRLWVNNCHLVDAWYEQAAQTYTEEIYLPGGNIPLKMEYFEQGGNAVARLKWVRLSQPVSITNWRGEYFNNTSLSGAPVLVRDDAQVSFNWGSGSPAPGVIGTDHFSARWTRSLNLSAGHYRFSVRTDDGARLWVNGQLVVDAWYEQSVRTHSKDIYLPGGSVPVKLEYYELGGDAVVQLSWDLVGASSSPDPSPAPAGTVIVDDVDGGFVKGGNPYGWRTVNEGYRDHLVWTKNNDVAQTNYNWARWYPNLAAGRYEVFVFIPERYTTTSSARYWVSHAGGYTSRIVDQSTNGDRWVSLGTYWFDGGSDEYVSLSDVTGETRVSRLIAFDAVKWEPR